MSKVTATYDSETGELSVNIDGSEIPNVCSFNIYVPEPYDSSTEMEYEQPSIQCNIITKEKSDDLIKRTNYSLANEFSKAAISNGFARKTKFPNLIENLHLEKSIAKYLCADDK